MIYLYFIQLPNIQNFASYLLGLRGVCCFATHSLIFAANGVTIKKLWAPIPMRSEKEFLSKNLNFYRS